MSVRTDLMMVVAVVLLASIFPVDLVPSALQEPRGSDGQLSGKQGQVLLVKVSVPEQATSAAGRFLSRRILFFPESDDGTVSRYVGVVGIDLQDPPGSQELVVEVATPQQLRRLSYNVLVIKATYPVQRLTLPREQVDLDDAKLARVKLEQEAVRRALDHLTQERYWRDAFIQPIHGGISGAFGRARIINGQVRSPHFGEDIAAPAGSEVVAMNDGVVRLTVDHFFSGKGVYLDHGLGLYSMYFHLSEVSVREGQLVTRGEVIGKVGASGRASGPHLHWGVWANGARIDPIALLALPVGPARAQTP